MKIIHRDLSKVQREELEGYVSYSAYVFRAILFLFLVIFSGYLFKNIQSYIYDGYPVWLVLTLAVSVWVYFYSSRWTGGSLLRKKIKEDLKFGKVKVSVVKPVSVVEFDELEDEGPAYIVCDCDGQSIFLSGQYLSKEKKKGFPWERFELVEAPSSEVFFGIKKLGDSISVTERRSPIQYKVEKKLGGFKKGYILLDEESRTFSE